MKGNDLHESQTIELIHTEDGFSKKEGTINGTEGEVVIHNTAKKTIGFIIGSPDSDYIANVIKTHPPYFSPFLN